MLNKCEASRNSLLPSPCAGSFVVLRMTILCTKLKNSKTYLNIIDIDSV